MNAIILARLLGWFNLALGITELLVPAMLRRQFGPSTRVVGDAMDIAVLCPAALATGRRTHTARRTHVATSKRALGAQEFVR